MTEKAELVKKWGISEALAKRARSKDSDLLIYSGPFAKGAMDFEILIEGDDREKIW